MTFQFPEFHQIINNQLILCLIVLHRNMIVVFVLQLPVVCLRCMVTMTSRKQQQAKHSIKDFILTY